MLTYDASLRAMWYAVGAGRHRTPDIRIIVAELQWAGQASLPLCELYRVSDSRWTGIVSDAEPSHSLHPPCLAHLLLVSA